MSNNQILEKAIHKAIDSGWEYPSCNICGFCPEAMNAHIDAQLKQSKESE